MSASTGWIAVSLGANVGAAAAIRARFCDAVSRVATFTSARATRVSSLYSTAPVGPILDQPAFLNAVAAFHATRVRPSGLMRELLSLERAAGRARGDGARSGPRTLDLDVLLIGDMTIDERGPPALRVPHPELARRRFVLAPLVEVFGPQFVVPDESRTLAELLIQPAVASQDVTRAGDPSWYRDP